MFSHKMEYVLRFFICHVCILKAVHIRADENEYRLVNKLLKNYDKRIRPSVNATHPLNVTFGLALSQIIDVDEKNQILTTNCWLNQMWIDYGLHWNPDEFGGIKVVRLPFDSIWRPDIFLYNNADVSTHFSSLSSNIIVTSDGNVTWLSMVIFKSSCSINVRYFPFDEQNCSMQFASWTYDGFQVNLIMTTSEGDTSNYIPNSEWDLQKLYVVRNVVYYSCCVEPYPDITFYIHIRRRPLFYIFNMMMPCILITLVALLGFYVPSDSGEKVTMGITTLLSMTVFMMLVTENMPPTSDVLPLIGIYYGITICIVSFATGMTVLTLNIHHKGHRGREVPPFFKRIFFDVFAKIFCMKLEPTTPVNKRKVYSPEFTGNSINKPYHKPFKVRTDSDNSRPLLDYRAREQHPSCRMEVHLDREFGPRPNGALPTIFPLPSHPSTSTNLPVNGGLDNFETHFSKVLQKVYQTIENNELRLEAQDRRELIKLEWQQVAQVVDRILLSAFVMATIVITCAVMFQKPPQTAT